MRAFATQRAMAYEVVTCAERKRDAKRARISLVQTGTSDSPKSRSEVTTSLKKLLAVFEDIARKTSTAIPAIRRMEYAILYILWTKRERPGL